MDENKARVVKYPEGYEAHQIKDSAAAIIDNVLELQIAFQSEYAAQKKIHDGLINIQRLARGLLVNASTGSATGEEGQDESGSH